MKLFTIGDFLKYNTPCFICNSNETLLFLNSYNIETKRYATITATSYINNQISFNIVTSYDSSLNISFNLKNSGFLTSNYKFFLNYTASHKFNIEITCENCRSSFTCSEITFDFIKLKTMPVFIKEEQVNIDNFIIRTDNIKEKTSIKYIGAIYTDDLFFKDLDSMSHEKYKTKEDFIKKIKVIQIFK